MQLARTHIFAAAAIALLIMAPHFANAKEDNKAQKIYKQAVAAYQQEHFAEALSGFKEAYNVTGKPDILYNLAICHEKLGETERAIAFYELYLEELPNAADAVAVSKKIDALKNPPPPSAATAPIESDVPKATQEPQTTANKDTSDASSASQSTNTTEPIPKSLNATNKDEGNQTPLKIQTSLDPFAHKRKIYQGLLIGLGSMVFATGALTAIAAYKKYDGYEATCAPDCSDSQVKKVRRLAIGADIQLGLGLAAIATGVIWAIWSKKKAKRQRTYPMANWRLEPMKTYLANGNHAIFPQGMSLGRNF